MLGKAVKFRHCPATVSAPGSTYVEPGNRPETTGAWLREGGRKRRKSGDRSCALNPLAFRGERRSIMSFRIIQRIISGRQVAYCVGAFILLAFFAVAAHAASIRGVVT